MIQDQPGFATFSSYLVLLTYLKYADQEGEERCAARPTSHPDGKLFRASVRVKGAPVIRTHISEDSATFLRWGDRKLHVVLMSVSSATVDLSKNKTRTFRRTRLGQRV